MSKSKQQIKQRVFEVIEENKKILKNFPCPDSLFYVDVRQLPSPTPKFESTVIEVVDGDSFDVAMLPVNQESSIPMVLNMASEKCPGGGCRHGSMTQEEMLMYRSNYYLSLSRMSTKYHLQFFNCIYTPQVLILRKNALENFDRLKNSERRIVSCLAMPALRNPKLDKGKYKARDRMIMTEKIRGMFKVGALHNHETLILGASGCGAFINPPKEVAQIFKEVLSEYDKCFKRVVFAILDNGRWENCTIFRSILTG